MRRMVREAAGTTPVPAPSADAAVSGSSAAGSAGSGSAALLSVCSARLVAANERVTDLEAQLQELTRVAAVALRAQSEAETQLSRLAHHASDGHHDGAPHDGRRDGGAGGHRDGLTSGSSSQTAGGTTITRHGPSVLASVAPLPVAVAAHAGPHAVSGDHHPSRGASGSDVDAAVAAAALTMERDSAVAALKEMCLALSRSHHHGDPITGSALRTPVVAVTRPTTSKESDGHDHHDDHDDHAHHDALRPLPLAGDSVDPPLLTTATVTMEVPPGGAADWVAEASSPEPFAGRPLQSPVPVTSGSDGHGARTSAPADAPASTASASDRVQRIRLIVAAQLAARAHRVTMTPAFQAAAKDNA